MGLSYQQVQDRLGEIEEDLGTRANEHEQTAEDLVRVQRDVKKRLASIRLTLKFGNDEKDTVQAREDKALTQLAAADDHVYDKWVNLEASYAGQKAAIELLERRASIGQSLLKAMTREQS